MENVQKGTRPVTSYLKFIIPSIIGIILFMIPISIGGEMTIPVAMLAKWLQELLADVLPALATVLILVSAVLTLIGSFIQTNLDHGSPLFKKFVSRVGVLGGHRVLGAVLAVLTLFQWGPDWVWFGNTGGLLLYDLIPVLFTVFIFAGLFMPFLMDFGLLEMTGTLLTRLMRPLFKLPGRASIDCLASWLGDGTIGVFAHQQAI